jgi:tryptophanyl-tRNA synthetase
MKKILFSGLQPTGVLHLGNYLGTMKNWVKFQDQYQAIFAIVDYHALTVPQDPKEFNRAILDSAAMVLALGIDPKKTILFVQSERSEHTEMTWILNCLTPIGELQRMTQFKEKSLKQKEQINAGLLDYPVLMAADILLYKAEVVPVGEDQEQHMELTRLLVRKFNRAYGHTFKEPQTLMGEVPRVMSLNNPQAKMSKSDSVSSYLALTDPPPLIKQKIMSAVTDLGPTKGTSMSQGVANLFTLLKAFNPQKASHFMESYQQKTIKYAELKAELATSIITELAPIQKRYQAIIKDQVQLRKTLKEGAQKAGEIAQKTLQEVKQKIGLN